MFPLQLSLAMKVLLLAPVFALVAIGLVNGEYEGTVCSKYEEVSSIAGRCTDLPSDPCADLDGPTPVT